MSERGNDTRIIAFMNQKGGVGKTTTTVNLAAALAERGRRVLVVDLDPQAHLTLHLGVDPAELEHTVYDLLIDESLTAEAVIVTDNPHLHVLPAEVDLAAAEQELSDASDRQSRLKSRLRAVADRYDFVLLDCPPSLGLLTLNALAAAHEVIVPMQAHFLALQGLSKLLETVQLVRQNVNTALRVSGVVLAMHEGQTNLAGEVVADLEQFFNASRPLAMPWSHAVIYQPPIRRNIKLAECPSFGQTIFEYAPHCAGAFDYAELASAIAPQADEQCSPASNPAQSHDAPPADDPAPSPANPADAENNPAEVGANHQPAPGTPPASEPRSQIDAADSHPAPTADPDRPLNDVHVGRDHEPRDGSAG